jgi:uncharacterized membrane protein
VTNLGLAGGGSPGGVLGAAVDINESAQVVGYVEQTYGDGASAWTGKKPALWENGQLQILDPGTPRNGIAESINDFGHIIVAENAPCPTWGDCTSEAYLLAAGVRTPILASRPAVWPDALNNRDQVVGSSDGGTIPGQEPGPPATRATRALLWQAAEQPMESPGLKNWVSDINEAGVAVGSQVPVVAASAYATVWRDGRSTRLAMGPELFGSYGNAINEQGDIVGDDGNGKAILWRNEQYRILNELIPPGSGWTGLWASDINDAGQIVGQASLTCDVFGVLMTPVLPGDVDGNKQVDARDVTAILRGVAGLRLITADEAWAGDVAPSPSSHPSGYGDGRLDISDAAQIMLQVSGLGG